MTDTPFMSAPTADVPGAAGTHGFGVFRLGRMQLALPLDVLREVVPCDRLSVVPSAAGCVVGAIDLRGTVLPVIDLRCLFGLPSERLDTACSVVVMVHEGRLIGLSADSVGGIFECPPDALSRMVGSRADPLIICAGFPRPDDGSLVNVLSPAAVCAIPDVPTVQDPRAACADVDEPAGGARLQHLMLMRCGQLALAVVSDAVHTTLLEPEVLASALGAGSCIGVIDYLGVNVPTVDLATLCGHPEHAAVGSRQVFIVRYEKGMVAFAVEEIIDVVHADIGRVTPAPKIGLHRPDLLTGVMSLNELPRHATRPVTAATGFYLLLDHRSLAGCDEVRALQRLNTPVDKDAAPSSWQALSTTADQTDTVQSQLLTYDIGVEVATPVEQISEILPWLPHTMLAEAGPNAAALLMNRGRAIPTFCLGRVVGRDAPPLSPSASVLVIENGGACIGFRVSRLVSIDVAQRPKNALPDSAETVEPGAEEVGRRRDYMLVGSGSAERLLSVVNLRELAQKLIAA